MEAFATANSTGFPPIAEYAFISDSKTGALLAPDGSVEWLCAPRFDSPSLFSSVLDRGAGYFRVGPIDVSVPLARRYEPGTNVLETTWMTPTGWLMVRDMLVIGPWRPGPHEGQTRPPSDAEGAAVLLRYLKCVDGRIDLDMVCAPRFDYGTVNPEWEPLHGSDTSVVARHDGLELRLCGDLRLGIEGAEVRARHTMEEGERRFVALSWDPAGGVPADAAEAEAQLDATRAYWHRWLSRGHFPDHPWRIYLQRSALVLKGLTYAPTGAMVAAPTTSLPETPGGERNWDYRYTWIRDASFTLWGLHTLGFDDEARDFMEFVGDVCAASDLQIMYGLDGRKELTESTLDHLTGYQGSRPVRIGNAAFSQRQNDVYGALMDSIYLHSKSRHQVPGGLWQVIAEQAEKASQVWSEPDQGIWEARGEPRHYTSSKLMCWVAMDRAARMAKVVERPIADKWAATAAEIKAEILARGLSDRGVFRQHYDTDALDASTLLMPLVRFLPADDERIRATVLAIADELTDHGMVLRYRVEETDDGLHGEEGTFAICSFWLVSALSEIGEDHRARHLCEKMLAHAGPLYLYGEEIEGHSGRHLGNFPQAFTHLALINAVSHVIAADTDIEIGPTARASR
jgi:GH15 family glucan-1,4-alpha-glucosidase